MCSLASGSKGNCVLVSNGNTNILIDAGISTLRIKKSLALIDLKIEDVDGVLITHEHSDHIKGLEVLSKHTKIFAHEKTMDAIRKKKSIASGSFESPNYYENGFDLGDFFVAPFRIPHDATYPLAYTFFNKGQKLAVATDIGHVTRGIINNLKSCNMMLLESNHDVNMLKTGPYPESLKKRVLGEKGHLSNNSSAELVDLVMSPKLERIVLGHISEQNNFPGLAKKTVEKTILDKGAKLNDDICLDVATQNVVTNLFELKK